jgi:hypothetical protein
LKYERAGMGLYGLGIIAVSSVGFAGKSVLGYMRLYFGIYSFACFEKHCFSAKEYEGCFYRFFYWRG